MVRVDLVRLKVARIRETGEALRRVLPQDAADLGLDRDRLDLVAFRVYLVLQESVDLASHVIADQGWGPAGSLRDHFAILAARGALDATLAAELSAGIKIRNLIGHAYVAIDARKLHVAALAVADLLPRFCAAMLAFAEANATV